MRTPTAVLFALMTMLALAGCGGFQSEDGLSAADERVLADQGRLRAGEHVLWFTSRGEDIEEAGSFFTETRVATYWAVDGADESVSIDLKDVTDLELKVHDDSWTQADYVTVTWGPDDRKTKIYLQSDGDGFPERFHEALTRQWEKARSR